MIAKIVLGLCVLIGLIGCDQEAQKMLRPGESTVDDVRKAMGRPEMIWEETDGSQVLEYPRGPAGHQTYMIVIGPDGRFRAMTNVLVPATFAKVTAGMDTEEVRRLLGRPTERVNFKARQENVWSWRHLGDQNRSTFFNVHFDYLGKVTKTGYSPDPQAVNTN